MQIGKFLSCNSAHVLKFNHAHILMVVALRSELGPSYYTY